MTKALVPDFYGCNCEVMTCGMRKADGTYTADMTEIPSLLWLIMMVYIRSSSRFELSLS